MSKSHLKKLVRARMEKTGESYQAALRAVRAAAPPLPDAEAAAKIRALDPFQDPAEHPKEDK